MRKSSGEFVLRMTLLETLSEGDLEAIVADILELRIGGFVGSTISCIRQVGDDNSMLSGISDGSDRCKVRDVFDFIARL